MLRTTSHDRAAAYAEHAVETRHKINPGDVFVVTDVFLYAFDNHDELVEPLYLENSAVMLVVAVLKSDDNYAVVLNEGRLYALYTYKFKHFTRFVSAAGET